MKRSYLNDHIAIPEYWSAYVSTEWDIAKDTKGPCPFHGEKHGNSFSYSPSRGYFSCFGQCKVFAGDVVALHQLNYKIKTRDEAERSLAQLIGVKEDEVVSFQRPEIHLNEKDVEYRVMYAKALNAAVTCDDYVALDYIMSQYPPTASRLELFVNERS